MLSLPASSPARPRTTPRVPRPGRSARGPSRRTAPARSRPRRRSRRTPRPAALGGGSVLRSPWSFRPSGASTSGDLGSSRVMKQGPPSSSDRTSPPASRRTPGCRRRGQLWGRAGGGPGRSSSNSITPWPFGSILPAGGFQRPANFTSAWPARVETVTGTEAVNRSAEVTFAALFGAATATACPATRLDVDADVLPRPRHPARSRPARSPAASNRSDSRTTGSAVRPTTLRPLELGRVPAHEGIAVRFLPLFLFFFFLPFSFTLGFLPV